MFYDPFSEMATSTPVVTATASDGVTATTATVAVGEGKLQAVRAAMTEEEKKATKAANVKRNLERLQGQLMKVIITHRSNHMIMVLMV